MIITHDGWSHTRGEEREGGGGVAAAVITASFGETRQLRVRGIREYAG